MEAAPLEGSSRAAGEGWPGVAVSQLPATLQSPSVTAPLKGSLLVTRRGGFHIRPGSLAAAHNSAGEQCSPLHLLHGGDVGGGVPDAPAGARTSRADIESAPTAYGMVMAIAGFHGASGTPPPTNQPYLPKHPQRIARWGCLFSYYSAGFVKV